MVWVASSPGHSQILPRSRGEKSGEGLVPILRHGPEMVPWWTRFLRNVIDNITLCKVILSMVMWTRDGNVPT